MSMAPLALASLASVRTETITFLASLASARIETITFLASLASARVESATYLPLLASARIEIATYLSTLIYVYTLLIIVYIVVQLLLSVGVRPPYSRTTDVVLGFLRDVCEPFLRIFRRLIPQFGMFDLSPILAIITLEILNGVVVQGIIHG